MPPNIIAFEKKLGPGIHMVHKPTPNKFKVARNPVDMAEFTNKSNEWAKNVDAVIRESHPKMWDKIKDNEVQLHFLDNSSFMVNLIRLGQRDSVGQDAGTFFLKKKGEERGIHHVVIDCGKLAQRGDPHRALSLLLHEIGGNVAGIEKAARKANKKKRKRQLERLRPMQEVAAHKGGIELMKKALSHKLLDNAAKETLIKAIEEDREHKRRWEKDLESLR